MQYTTEVIIEKPIAEVVKKMDSIDNLKHWQSDLLSTEHISGTPGEFGAKMKLTYAFGKQSMEMVETITKRNFPDEFHATYATKTMRNIQQNFFKTTDKGHTKWISKSEFQPKTFMMRAMIFFMPRAFKKQTLKYMLAFKNFVEHGTSVAHA